ncbi:hypothetical protein HYPSUDRAFT_209608 [Hypholoma sublateritium FD-334 SS-4]|uniref:Uncharacterized protein n=1 Tax=Hypholoma sublateritium (strain FD-334 SS-4) TaxID=945553 RepID=A0A0D2N289_HYPSF|nr:hypothetical protein HYPSUDRAFT_209608 [Hypholoma sublateritium FD-334 SS-4]
MPPKNSSKKLSAMGVFPGVNEPSQRDNRPVKRKLLRPKSPSPVPETDDNQSDLDDAAESVVDNDAESGDQDESGGLDAADDSMAEFIDHQEIEDW